MPSVSVVTPSFRGGVYLRESIASVQSQTLEDWELIVVLDGCEDDLSDITRDDQRVRVVRQHRRGASIARNVGIMHAQSSLIAFLDDDDRMLPDRLGAQVGAMSSIEVGICHSQYQYIDANGVPIGPGQSRESQYRDFLRGGGAILPGSSMIRKSLIQEVGGFNSLLRVGEDLDLIYRVARESKVTFLPEILVEYRQHDDNTWLDKGATAGEFKMILTQHLWAAEAHGEVENIRAVQLGLSAILTGRAALAMHRANQARATHDYVGFLRGLGLALLFSPRATIRTALRAIRREM